MKDVDPGFTIIPPEPPNSPEVREFFATNPEFDLHRSLAFLDSHYPDKDTWLVDSGIAVQLLTGRRQNAASDIDIVCRDDAMEQDFGHADGLDPNDDRYIDVKSIQHWLVGRPTDADAHLVWDGIIATSSMLEIDGITARVMHPAIIAAGKSTLARMSPRPKDATDITLLDVPPEQLAAATELLCGHDINMQVELLRQTAEI